MNCKLWRRAIAAAANFQTTRTGRWIAERGDRRSCRPLEEEPSHRALPAVWPPLTIHPNFIQSSE